MQSKPKELVVISGKGGTGKTPIVTSFAALAEKVMLADCRQHLSFEIGAQREQDQPQAAGGMRRGTGIRAVSSVHKE